MKLTDEQKEIIHSKAEILKVNAVAGSGKTTTLIEYAATRANKSILYLAYNKAIAEEITFKLSTKNIKNVFVTTIHALAYKATEAWNYRFYELDEVGVSKLLGLNTPLYAWLVKDLFSFYCNSRLIQLDKKLLEHYIYTTRPSAELLKILENQDLELLGHVKYILTQMRQGTYPVTHDFYLKLYYLYKPKLYNDIIMVDEAQDISDVMSAIIEMQSANKVYVGDAFQQIYGFRFAMNALKNIEAEFLTLSQSFRFGNGYAKKLSETINVAYDLLGSDKISMSGSSNFTKMGYKAVDFSKPVTVLSRSNSALFENVLKYLKEKKSIYFEGGYGSYNFMNKMVFSILMLHNGEMEKVEHEMISQFESMQELKDYSNETQNQNLKNMISLVEKYDKELFSFNNSIKELLCDEESAEITFSTTHKSKGKEYDQVIMAQDDFINLEAITKMKEDEKVSILSIIEEVNIYYVAATRAKNVIVLADFEKANRFKADTFSQKKIVPKFKDSKTIKPKQSTFRRRKAKRSESEMINDWKKENGY